MSNNVPTITDAKIILKAALGSRIYDYDIMMKLLKNLTEDNNSLFKEENELSIKAVTELIAEME